MVRIVAQGLLFSGFGFASPALGRAVSEEPLERPRQPGFHPGCMVWAYTAAEDFNR